MFVHVRLHHDNAPIHTSKLVKQYFIPTVLSRSSQLRLIPVSKIKKELISRGSPYGHRTQYPKGLVLVELTSAFIFHKRNKILN